MAAPKTTAPLGSEIVPPDGSAVALGERSHSPQQSKNRKTEKPPVVLLVPDTKVQPSLNSQEPCRWPFLQTYANVKTYHTTHEMSTAV
jgi:hypothetical protein